MFYLAQIYELGEYEEKPDITMGGNRLMIHFNEKEVSELTNRNIDKLLFEDIVCYVFVGGNPGGTEGNIYVFELRDTELRLYRGNIYGKQLDADRVYSLLQGSDGFFGNWKRTMHADGWECVPFVMGYYVFVKDFMAKSLEVNWKKIDTKYHIDRMIEGVYVTCQQNEDKLNALTGTQTGQQNKKVDFMPLKSIIDEYPDSLDNYKLFKALLMDYYPDNKFLRNLLLTSIEERIPHEIKKCTECNDSDFYRYSKLLVDAHGCPLKKAQKVVVLWIDVFGKKVNGAGKEKCKKLREIREKIAQANNIEFHTKECHHIEPCRGTCPLCDSEIKYLDEQILKIKEQGGAIILAGIASDEIEQSGCNVEPEISTDIIDGGLEPISMGALIPEEIGESIADMDTDDDLWDAW